MNLCDDNRIITIEKAKQALIKGTNIEDSPEEIKVLDNILFRCWQMGWLDRYDPPMPSNTSNALKALNSVNATQFNALDSISRQAAIETVMDCYDNAELFEVYEEKMRELPPAQPTPDQNGDLWITVPDIDEVTCVYVQENKSKFCRIFYEEQEQPERIIHCKDCEWWTKQECSPQGRCALSGMYPTGGWFCGNARRREVTT